jgi:SAM-dependent methyltransferase
VKAYLEQEQALRDREAAGYEAWYVQTKGAAFDLREKAIFADALRGRGFDRVLDVGCGTGRITGAVAPVVKAVMAVDHSERSLDVLRRKNLPNVSARRLDAAGHLPFADASFQAVVACQVVQHWEPAERAVFLADCRRILVRGGLFLCSVYNRDYFGYGGVAEVRSGGLYCRRFDAREVRQMAGRTGFSVRRISYYRALPARLFRQSARAYPVLAFLDEAAGAIPLLGKKLGGYLFAVMEARE